METRIENWATSWNNEIMKTIFGVLDDVMNGHWWLIDDVMLCFSPCCQKREIPVDGKNKTHSRLLLDSLFKLHHQYCIAHSSWSADPDCTSTLTFWHCHRLCVGLCRKQSLSTVCFKSRFFLQKHVVNFNVGASWNATLWTFGNEMTLNKKILSFCAWILLVGESFFFFYKPNTQVEPLFSPKVS